MLPKTTSNLILLISLFWASSVLATNAVNKDSYPLITYKCDPAKDILLITNTLLKDGKEKGFKYSDAEGTYSPWDMVTIKNDTIVDTSAIQKDCKLSSTNYTIILEPQVFNPNLANQKLDGFCGTKISAALTILVNNEVIQERKAFEFHCSGNTKVITGVKVIGKTGEIRIRAVPRYKYY